MENLKKQSELTGTPDRGAELSTGELAAVVGGTPQAPAGGVSESASFNFAQVTWEYSK